MKRGKRPFTVEVKRTGKRPAAGEPDTGGMSLDPDILRRAEEALGQQTRQEFVEPSAAEADKPKGRILPNLTEEPPEVLMAEEIPAPRKRGRPPGSKNKPKLGGAQAQTPGLPKRRGRPPKVQAGPVTRPAWFAPPALLPVGTSTMAAVQGAPVPEGELAPLPRRERRMSTILGRWVYRTVPTRGERWKRRLR